MGRQLRVVIEIGTTLSTMPISNVIRWVLTSIHGWTMLSVTLLADTVGRGESDREFKRMFRMLRRLNNGGAMTTKVEKIAEQVKALPDDEREEFLSWLADFEIEHSDDWDKEIARDSQSGARFEHVLGRVRKDIAEGRTKSLDKVLDNS
jgi:hypothetical protein